MKARRSESRSRRAQFRCIAVVVAALLISMLAACTRHLSQDWSSSRHPIATNYPQFRPVTDFAEEKGSIRPALEPSMPVTGPIPDSSVQLDKFL